MKNPVIWTSKNGPLFRIVQLSPTDCLVEMTMSPNAEAPKESSWEAVDDDALVANVYMTAFLEVRESNRT